MKRIILALTSLMLLSAAASAEVSHVSIHKRLFELGEAAKVEVNIVSSHHQPKKVQFLLRQSSGEVRLASTPVTPFMRLVTSVDTVVDKNAVLVVREHRINRWREVALLNLFSDNTAEITTNRISLPDDNNLAYADNVAVMNSRAKAAGMTQLNLSTAEPVVASQCMIAFNGRETLWRIGVRQATIWNMNTFGTILAIFETNPNAFNHGSINGLRANAQLKCPTKATLEKYADAAAAEKQFDATR
ncbi:FimV/HubP family polar landmark protein [Shewanella youngdeokensis]|uniref:FimV/HubP family polar landmark protein n=1 Tax=Shewanella youngdeokensis TaxID=2999068 RepID=A0ABZ0JWW6_9GAMM|nr:FimV/HubP family polar landmark protein [Shewanella sp. DAU334]